MIYLTISVNYIPEISIINVGHDIFAMHIDQYQNLRLQRRIMGVENGPACSLFCLHCAADREQSIFDN
jgi:hypothetical protein